MIPFVQLVEISQAACIYKIYSKMDNKKDTLSIDKTIDLQKDDIIFEQTSSIELSQNLCVTIFQLTVPRPNTEKDGLICFLNNNKTLFLSIPCVNKKLTVRIKNDTSFSNKEFEYADIAIIYNKSFWFNISTFGKTKDDKINLSIENRIKYLCLNEIFKISNVNKIVTLIPTVIFSQNVEDVFSKATGKVKEIFQKEKEILDLFSIQMFNSNKEAFVYDKIDNISILLNPKLENICDVIINNKRPNLLILSEWDLLRIDYKDVSTICNLSFEEYSTYFDTYNNYTDIDLQTIKGLILDSLKKYNIIWVSTNSPIQYQMYLEIPKNFIQYSLIQKNKFTKHTAMIRFLLSHIYLCDIYKLTNFSKTNEINLLYDNESFIVEMQ